MQSSAPLLSLCIPTYNQPEALEELFECIKNQLTSEIEVIVRDDSTNEESSRIVEKYRARGILCRYHRGKKEGLDAAILTLTEMAQGEYVWWMGDDTIAEGGMARVLKILHSQPKLSLLLLNSIEKNASLPTFQLSRDRIFTDRNEVIEEFSDSLGFISATILNREDARSGLQKARTVIGTAWVNLFLVLHALGKGSPAYFLHEPILLTSSRDPSVPAWYDGFTVFALNFFHILNGFRDVFRRRSIRRAIARNFRKIWRGIMVYRAKGYSHNLGGFHVNIKTLLPLYWSFLQFWIALPFLLLPRSWTPFLYRWYLKLFR